MLPMLTLIHHSSGEHLLLTLFRMGLFGAAHALGEAKRPPFPKIYYTYLTKMNLAQFYLI